MIRLDLNCDYDRLHELVNHHDTIREMLGHGAFGDVYYHFKTLKDNVGLLTPQLLDEINQRIVKAGHALLKKKDGEAQRRRCDSFVACRKQLFDLSDDMATRLDIEFYRDGRDALLKALAD